MSWPIVYGVKHKNEEVRMNSRSGGIFTALSDYILEHDGIVYGCILNDDLKAVHIRATTKLERDKMRGSKYVQSDLGDVFDKVKQDLISEKMVLFSGTSCQIAGLKSYLTKQYDNLFCLDIVCHGVPSFGFWNDYVKWQETKHSAHCYSADFRNKIKYGWADHVETLYMIKGNDKFEVDSRIYRDLFYEHVILRPSCYKCPYKSTIHPADITIADFWGIDKAIPDFNDNRGVSLVLINNEKGKQLFDIIRNQIVCEESRIQDCMQPPLEKSFDEPSYRTTFWEEYFKFPFSVIVAKYTYHGIFQRIQRLIRRFIK